MKKLLLILAIELFATRAGATVDAWRAWEQETKAQCPSHHVEWIYGDSYDELLGGFTQTLSNATNRRIDAIADYEHRCASETMGFSCEMSVHLDTFQRLGLLKHFAAFACQHYKCIEFANCYRR